MLNVLVVGQTPPPVHGQAVLIEKLLAGRFERVRLSHVRMAFSRTVDELGTVRLAKLFHLAELIAKIVAARVRHRAQLLYYPPAGNERVPVLRDLALLLAVRPLFRYTVFHFHATGLGELYTRLSRPERWLFDRAYGAPDVAIIQSEHNLPDVARLRPRHTLVVPPGIEDDPPYPGPRETREAPVILFVGMVRADKGVDTLLEAARRLAERGIDFRLEIVGPFGSAGYESEAREFVSRHALERRVRFRGQLTGAEKWERYAAADIFCFPSRYAAETFGLVVLEAMRFGLPVVATRWRGLTSLVEEGRTGLLVRPGDDEGVARHLATLLAEPERRRAMGARGRERYLENYTVERWYQRMEDAFLRAADRA